LAAGNYRSCLGFEDYDLWARMLMKGNQFHNLEEVLVHVRSGNGMQSRRGGTSYLKQEINLQLRLYGMSFFSAAQCAMNILLRAPIRLVPVPLRSWLYQVFLRDPVVSGSASISHAALTPMGAGFVPERNAK